MNREDTFRQICELKDKYGFSTNEAINFMRYEMEDEISCRLDCLGAECVSIRGSLSELSDCVYQGNNLGNTYSTLRITGSVYRDD